MFEYNTEANGKVNRCKVRFLARGYTQLKGVYYEKTWAACAARATVRVVLAMVADGGWKMHSVDVKTAYLTETMDRKMYI